jgi:hypothetical protein
MRRTAPAFGLVLAAALTLGALAAPQVAGLPTELVTAKEPLTADQQSRLNEYVTRMGNMFAIGNPSEVVSARNELVDLCRSSIASEIFRRDLAAALVKAFEPLTKSPETFRATNAFLVAQFLRSSDAIDFLVANIDPETQPDAGLRATAAQQLPRAGPNANLSPPQIDALSKKLAAAARKETSWRAIAAEIDAVGELLRMKLPSAQAEAVAEAQASMINSVTERFENQKELVSALQRGLLVVRNQLTSVTEPGRGKLLKGISPSLTQITQMPKANVDAFKADPLQDAAFKNVVITAELLQQVGKLDR